MRIVKCIDCKKEKKCYTKAKDKCKSCYYRKYKKKYYKDNKEKYKELSRKYYSLNRTKIAEQSKIYRQRPEVKERLNKYSKKGGYHDPNTNVRANALLNSKRKHFKLTERTKRLLKMSPEELLAEVGYK